MWRAGRVGGGKEAEEGGRKWEERGTEGDMIYFHQDPDGDVR